MLETDAEQMGMRDREESVMTPPDFWLDQLGGKCRDGKGRAGAVWGSKSMSSLLLHEASSRPSARKQFLPLDNHPAVGNIIILYSYLSV